DELGELVSEDGGGESDDPEQRGGDQRGEDDQREDEVLGDDTAGASSDGDGGDDSGEVVGHEGDISGLEGNVAAGGAHGDPDAGRREGWGVVDAVADHGHVVEAVDELTNRRCLVFGLET